jgi:CBS domain containing-hemolysin-like protein
VSLTVWVGIAALILATALYVAAEFAAVGVRRSRVRRLAEDGNALARRLLPFVEQPAGLDQYVAVSQVGITLSSLILGAFGQATIAVALAPRLAGAAAFDAATAAYWAALIVLIGLTAAQVILGELVPKSLALQYPTGVALATVLPMRWSLRVFRPLIWLLNGSATGLLRLLRVPVSTHRHLHSPDEIALMIAESRDGGLLEPDELQRLQRALRLSLRTARDLMVPLDRLTMVEVDTPWPDVVRLVAASPFSRLPVHRGDRTSVIGMLRVKDLVGRFVREGGAVALERLVRPVLRVTHELPADALIALLRERRTHQAAVIDAAGAVIGFVSIQDVIGEFLAPRERAS